MKKVKKLKKKERMKFFFFFFFEIGYTTTETLTQMNKKIENKIKSILKKIENEKNKDKKIIFKSADDDLNRKVMEKLPIQTILIPLDGRKDYLKQRDAGFNQVMAKVAKKKDIALGKELNELINRKNKKIS